MNYNDYIALSIVPFLILTVVPCCFALILCLVGLCTHICNWCCSCVKEKKDLDNIPLVENNTDTLKQGDGDGIPDYRSCTPQSSPAPKQGINSKIEVVKEEETYRKKCGNCLEETIIYRFVRNNVVGIKTAEISGENMLYGYKVSAPVMYYLFFFTIYLYSATSGIFWTRFALRESHGCDSQDVDRDCFNITRNNHSRVDCNKNVSDIQVVCFEFVFAFNNAFSSAAGVFSSCFFVSTAIMFVGLIISGGNNKLPCKYLRWFIAFAVVAIIFIVTTLLYAKIIYFLHYGNRSSRDVTETINVTIVYCTVLLACFVPWYCFHEKEDENLYFSKNNQNKNENTDQSN